MAKYHNRAQETHTATKPRHATPHAHVQTHTKHTQTHTQNPAASPREGSGDTGGKENKRKTRGRLKKEQKTTKIRTRGKEGRDGEVEGMGMK